MEVPVLHRLRSRRRGLGSAALAVFALNFLLLALAPCAMAYAAAPTAAAVEHCPHCPPPEAPQDCHESATATPSTCEAVPKPALEARDANPTQGALLLALTAPLLQWLAPDPSAGTPPVAHAVPIPAAAPFDRFGRRLE